MSLSLGFSLVVSLSQWGGTGVTITGVFTGGVTITMGGGHWCHYHWDFHWWCHYHNGGGGALVSISLGVSLLVSISGSLVSLSGVL